MPHETRARGRPPPKPPPLPKGPPPSERGTYPAPKTPGFPKPLRNFCHLDDMTARNTNVNGMGQM